MLPVVETKWTRACNKARELGATVQHGISWTWAESFPTRDEAEEFLKFLRENGYDDRGIYADESQNPNGPCSVRFRED